ncbi:MAG: TolC family protein [Ignavibacteria bacterium]
MEDGKWKMENVERSEIPLCGRRWKIPQAGKEEDGRWKMVDGRWKMINDKLKIEYGILYPASCILYTVSYILLISIVFSLLSALCTVTFSQSVDSLINEAMLNNPQLKALESRIKSAEFKSEGVDYLPPPSIALEFAQVPFQNPDPINQAISQNLSVSQMFMLGGKLNAMEEAERKNVSIAEKEYEAYKYKLFSVIKSKYYEIWMNEHHMELRDENINLLEDLLRSTQNLYTVGRAKYSDLLMLKAELADNETNYKTFENNVSAAIFQMNSLLGRDLENKDLEVYHAWLIDSLKYSPEELQEKLISSNPEIQRMQQMIEMNELEINVNDKELIPDLMLQGMVMRMPRGMYVTTKSPPDMMNGMGKTEYMYGLMASVNLPFAPWSSGRYSAREEELHSTISGLASEKLDMQRRMISDLKTMIEKLKSARNQLHLYSNQVIPLYKQTLEAQLSEFQNSRISINDLISTMKMLLMKEEEEAEVKMNYQMIFSEIENMVGQRLTGKSKE